MHTSDSITYWSFEADKWFRVSVSVRSGRVSTLSATTTLENMEKPSVQQLEQVLAKKRLSIERTEVGKSTLKIDTIVAYPTDAVGPVVYLGLAIEGHPVSLMYNPATWIVASSCQLHAITGTYYSNSSATKCKTLSK